MSDTPNTDRLQELVESGALDMPKTTFVKQAGEKLFVVNGADELITQDGTKIKFNPEDDRITGQEWYDRFIKELGEPEVFVGYGYDSIGYDEDDVLEAAKRAAGIEETKL